MASAGTPYRLVPAHFYPCPPMVPPLCRRRRRTGMWLRAATAALTGRFRTVAEIDRASPPCNWEQIFADKIVRPLPRPQIYPSPTGAPPAEIAGADSPPSVADFTPNANSGVSN